MASTAPELPMGTEGQILIASSQAEFRQRIRQRLPDATLRAVEAAGGADALMKLGESDYRTLFLDSEIEDLDVNELVDTIHLRHPKLEVVVLEPGDGDTKLPARLAESGEEGANRFEQDRPQVAAPLRGIIGTSAGMQQVYRLAHLIAPRSTNVLIVGATGTGKELVARGIHGLSSRKDKPFIVVNCAAIPESLLEAELFGFMRGAFTGAFESRLGRIHAAHGGTLLLDEVGELPLSMQAKLLRFVQEGEVQRLGSADLFRVDARIIAATNVDLLGRVREKQFREDLYYRLAVFPIDLPPLRDRVEDILPLARHFLQRLDEKENAPAQSFRAEADALLQKYSWPGNVRELQHRVERAFVMAESNKEICAADLGLSTERS